MNFQLSRPDGAPIQDWRQWSPPKSSRHWRAGRSAMELARAWFTAPSPRMPPEFEALLQSSPLLDGLTNLVGVPEFVTALPEPGEGRNHDLVLEGETGLGKVLIAVEAKADERFGQRLGKYWAKKREERETPDGKPSRAPERIDGLLSLLAGVGPRANELPWSHVRYQLLTAAVGTLIEAQQRTASLAVMAVHEFHTTETDRECLDRNSVDFEEFLVTLGLVSPGTVTAGKLYGPWKSPNIHIPLLIGKAISDWGAA